MKGLKRLEVIQELSRKSPDWKHKELFRLLRKEDIWITAYENIKSNKGTLTSESEVTKETLDRIGLTGLYKLQASVLDESYQFKSVKLTQIPKSNGQKLLIPTLNDKIVQEVIRIILAAIYEPNFDSRSFGFRKNLGVHDALSYVETKFRWIDWIIENNIQSAYSTINHNKLCEILEQRIEDSRFINLIRKSLKCNVFENPKTLYSSLGVPQGSIVSPILVNIYFNELDKWVTQKANKVYVEKYLIWNPEYRKLEYQIKKTDTTSETLKHLSQPIKKLIQECNKILILPDQRIEIQYTRYADNWIIGVKGPKKLAEQIKAELGHFLLTDLKQEFHPEKTRITELQSGKVYFLGYYIFLPRNMKMGKYKEGEGKQIMRRSTPTLRFQLPLDQVIKRLKERGYITGVNNKIRPISKSSYSSLEDAVIVNHFRSVWLGLFNFYSGSTNRSQLQYIQYLLHLSCAMTLAHRHRLSSTKIFKKHGKRLEIIDKTETPSKVVAAFPYQTSWKYSDRKWHYGKRLKDPFRNSSSI
jgi:nicotine oxidoreductase